MFGLCLLIRQWADHRQAQITSAINQELERLVKGEPCQSASLLLVVGRVVGSEAGRSAKAALMAELSHVQRQANSAVVDEAIESVGEKQPMLGAMLQGMGRNKQKSLLNNPLVQMALSALTAGKGGGNHAPRSKPPQSFSL